jgi:hypothetical protein
VRWNLRKNYLRDLEERGAAIVPSTWHEDFGDAAIESWFEAHDGDRLVIKPQVGANAMDIYVLQRPIDPAFVDSLARIFRARPFFVQPFVDAIRTDGEYSLFFLGGSLSHAIRKVPKPGDFRVQEEHGADIQPTEPEAALCEAGRLVMTLVSPAPAYARADFVRGRDGRWLLMELELVEPSLYLRMDPAAPERFARAFDAHVRAAGAS